MLIMKGDALAGPSSFWSEFPLADMLQDPNIGYFNEFHGRNIPSLAAGTDDFPGLAYFLDTSDTTVAIPGLGLASYGSILTSATQNDGPIIAMGGLSSACYQITTGTGKKLAFEASIGSDSAVYTDMSLFIGLASQTTIASLVANDGILTDTTGAPKSTGLNIVGFHAPAAVGVAPVLSAVHMKAGAALQTNLASAITMATGTFYNVGFVFDPNNDTLKFFVNGALVATKDVGDLGTTTFPSATSMTPVLALKNSGAGAVKKLNFKWIRAAQLAV